MIFSLVLTLTFLASPQKTLCLKCCDSTLSGLPVTENREKAKECVTTEMTKPKLGNDRGKGAGKPCDFCTIEVFFKEGVGENADQEYFLQSCGSFETADYEYELAGVDPMKVKAPENADGVSAAKSNHNLENYIQFGVELSKYDNKTKRACKVHQERGGYLLVREPINAGVWENVEPLGDRPTTIGWKDVPLDGIPSVACACFDDKCNAKHDVIPIKEDQHRGNGIKWNYGSKDNSN